MKVAPDTYLIPNLAPAGPDTYVPVNSLVILGEEPIIVDTGAPVHREHWLEMVFGLVDPEDIRWVFLSHEDGDHTGGLDQRARGRAAGDAGHELVQHRAARPRAAGAPRAHRSGASPARPSTPATVACASCCRRSSTAPPPAASSTRRPACCGRSTPSPPLTTGAVHHVEDLPKDLYDESFMFFNSLISPWHQFLDPVRYNRHVDTVEALKPRVVASAHGPILVGDAIHDAFDRVRTLAGAADHRPARPGGPRRDPRRRHRGVAPSPGRQHQPPPR